MKKIPVEQVKNPGSRKSIIEGHKKFGETISINGCNGSSDLGQLTSAVANRIRDIVPNAFVRCPYALYPEVEGPSQTLLYDNFQIVLDGCKERCLKKTLEKAGIKVDLAYAMDEDFGFDKHPQPAKFTEEQVEIVVQRILKDIEKLGMRRKEKEKLTEVG